MAIVTTHSNFGAQENKGMLTAQHSDVFLQSKGQAFPPIYKRFRFPSSMSLSYNAIHYEFHVLMLR